MKVALDFSEGRLITNVLIFENNMFCSVSVGVCHIWALSV